MNINSIADASSAAHKLGLIFTGQGNTNFLFATKDGEIVKAPIGSSLMGLEERLKRISYPTGNPHSSLTGFDPMDAGNPSFDNLPLGTQVIVAVPSLIGRNTNRSVGGRITGSKDGSGQYLFTPVSGDPPFLVHPRRIIEVVDEPTDNPRRGDIRSAVESFLISQDSATSPVSFTVEYQNRMGPNSDQFLGFLQDLAFKRGVVITDNTTGGGEHQVHIDAPNRIVYQQFRRDVVNHRLYRKLKVGIDIDEPDEGDGPTENPAIPKFERVTIRRKASTDEWLVFPKGGVAEGDHTYFTDGLNDAIATARFLDATLIGQQPTGNPNQAKVLIDVSYGFKRPAKGRLLNHLQAAVKHLGMKSLGLQPKSGYGPRFHTIRLEAPNIKTANQFVSDLGTHSAWYEAGHEVRLHDTSSPFNNPPPASNPLFGFGKKADSAPLITLIAKEIQRTCKGSRVQTHSKSEMTMTWPQKLARPLELSLTPGTTLSFNWNRSVISITNDSISSLVADLKELIE